MNTLHRLWWLYTGEVARIVEEEFEDTSHAVAHPLAGVALTAMTTALSVQSRDLVLQTVAAGFSLGFAALTLTSLGAAYVYATERTEVPV